MRSEVQLFPGPSIESQSPQSFTTVAGFFVGTVAGGQCQPTIQSESTACETQAVGLSFKGMPTILRIDGYRVLILLPPREHGPAHVHVAHAGGTMIVELLTLQVRDVRGMGDADVRRAVRIVA